MKRGLIYTTILALCMALSTTHRVHATAVSDIILTRSTNSLASNTSTGLSLPAGFIDAVFDDSNNPRMDKLLLLMTMPADFTTISFDGTNTGVGTIPGIDIVANGDYLFEFNADAANHRYVLASTPIDPTERAVQTIYLEKNETMKVYLTGSLTGNDALGNPKKVNAELPAGIKMVLPESLEPMRAVINTLFLDFIDDMIQHPERFDGATKALITLLKNNGGLSLVENTEGFIYFEGNESSKLDLYIEDFSVSVKDKQLDFLGSLFGPQLAINLLSFDQVMLTTTQEDIIDAVKNTLGESSADWAAIQSLKATKYAALVEEYKTTHSGFTPADASDEDEAAVQAQAYIDAMTQLAGSNATIASALSSAQIAQTAEAKMLTRMQTVIKEMAMAQIGERLGGVTSGGDNTFSAMGKMFNGLIQGTASPIAFSSLSERIENESFQVNIHSKGENTLTGGAKSNFVNVTIFGMEGNNPDNDMYQLCRIFEQMVNFTSASIAVRPSAKLAEQENFEYTCAQLTFDDVWSDGTPHTNGLLCLPVVGHDLDAPSIDLGNPNGQAIFNSGRYKMHTAASNKIRSMFYVATMAICYRELSVTMPGAGGITYTGIGTSVGSGRSAYKQDKYQNVIIYDGTFETYSAEAWTSLGDGDAVDVVANGWYNKYTDLRLPYNTTVYGGSFSNCEVYRCDAAAELGVEPVYIYNLTDITPLCTRKPYAANTLDADYVTSSGAPLVVDNASTLTFHPKAGAGTTTWVYGHKSLTPASDGFVYLYVPEGDCSAEATYMRNYTTSILPLGEHHVGIDMITMGGSVHVDNRFQNVYDQQNAYLLYTRLNQYTFQNAHVQFVGGIERSVEKEFSTMSNKNSYRNSPPDDSLRVYFADIDNQGSYIIEYGIYMMLPILSDQWMIFCPPYDVANVYVMETTTEQPTAMKTSQNAGGWTNADYHSFFERQGVADGNMAQILVTSVLPDIFSGKGSGVKMPLPKILNNMTNKSTHLTRLTHYDGSFSSLRTANYYLNEMVPDVEGTTLWKMEKEDKYYGNKWIPAPKQSTPTFYSEQDPDCVDLGSCDDIVYPYVDQDGNVQAQQYCIMKRDHIYSMYFPGGNNRWYDYKYLIIEGYGPQELKGSATHNSYYGHKRKVGDEDVDILPEDNYIALQGNNTFATDTVKDITSSHPLFYPEMANGEFSLDLSGIKPYYHFTQNTNAQQQIMPATVYIVSSTASATKASMPMLHNDANTGTDLITNPNLPALINRSLDAWADNGIYLRALQEQHIEIFSTTGTLIWQGTVNAGTTTFVPADRGMYIIRGEETTVKVVN